MSSRRWAYIDSLKFAGGAFTLMPEEAVRSIIELCHKNDVLVSTGGFIERVLAQAATRSANTLPNANGSGSISSKFPRDSSQFQLTIGCG
jgi:phosphosulfolactate synthase (CoM biosynthesis protein A)